jgi:hypothetical protein
MDFIHSVHDGRMKTLMNDTQLETLDQIRQFLEGPEAISFQIEKVIIHS